MGHHSFEVDTKLDYPRSGKSLSARAYGRGLVHWQRDRGHNQIGGAHARRRDGQDDGVIRETEAELYYGFKICEQQPVRGVETWLAERSDTPYLAFDGPISIISWAIHAIIPTECVPFFCALLTMQYPVGSRLGELKSVPLPRRTGRFLAYHLRPSGKALVPS